MRVVEALCPSGVSSFFEVCVVDKSGEPISDPLRIGARGGGFGISRGVKVGVQIRRSSTNRIKFRVNSHPTTKVQTTRWALERLMRRARRNQEVSVDLTIRVPVGAGYGMSAAGTLATLLAYSEAEGISYTYNELGRLAHVAEVVNGTGLGTVPALLEGGFVIVAEPGAPGVGLVDRINFPAEHSIVCAYLGPIATKKILSQHRIANRVNPTAQITMKEIRKSPNVETFLSAAERFSERVGLQTPEVSTLIRLAKDAGAVGAAQNMLGNAVHAVVPNSKINHVTRVLKKYSRRPLVFTSDLDYRGVRLA